MPNRRHDVQGWIYIAHFVPAFKHAKHYTGWTEDLRTRFQAHRKGQGSNLIKHVIHAGHVIKLFVVKRGTRKEERRLKNSAHPERICPICRKRKLEFLSPVNVAPL